MINHDYCGANLKAFIQVAVIVNSFGCLNIKTNANKTRDDNSFDHLDGGGVGDVPLEEAPLEGAQGQALP